MAKQARLVLPEPLTCSLLDSPHPQSYARPISTSPFWKPLPPWHSTVQSSLAAARAILGWSAQSGCGFWARGCTVFVSGAECLWQSPR